MNRVVFAAIACVLFFVSGWIACGRYQSSRPVANNGALSNALVAQSNAVRGTVQLSNQLQGIKLQLDYADGISQSIAGGIVELSEQLELCTNAADCSRIELLRLRETINRICKNASN